MWELLANFVEQLASVAAGATSFLNSYQPKTPECLLEDEE